MNLEWTKHLKTDKEKKEFEEILKRNTLIVERTKELIQDRLNLLNRVETSEKDFETPNWDYRQAKRIGMRAAYNEILDLFNLNKRIITL